MILSVKKGTDMEIKIICEIISEIRGGNFQKGRDIILSKYPFQKKEVYNRNYTIKQKMDQFRKDGFIDRYSGDKLLNPGIIKVITYYYPLEFPYHPHWKMTECHIAYWEFMPSIDHINPIARGGVDDPCNWVTTSMMNNMIKSNWTLEQIRWQLYPPGNINDWDGMTSLFVEMVDNNSELLSDNYIKTWYNQSK